MTENDSKFTITDVLHNNLVFDTCAAQLRISALEDALLIADIKGLSDEYREKLKKAIAEREQKINKLLTALDPLQETNYRIFQACEIIYMRGLQQSQERIAMAFGIDKETDESEDDGSCWKEEGCECGCGCKEDSED